MYNESYYTVDEPINGVKNFVSDSEYYEYLEEHNE